MLLHDKKRQYAIWLRETFKFMSTGYWGFGTNFSTVSVFLQNSYFTLNIYISAITCDLILTSNNSFPFLQRSKTITFSSLISTSVSTDDVVVHLMPFFQRVQA